jgi:hypothetical protein
MHMGVEELVRRRTHSNEADDTGVYMLNVGQNIVNNKLQIKKIISLSSGIYIISKIMLTENSSTII